MCAPYATSTSARGFLAAMSNSVRAAPEGARRPCSHAHSETEPRYLRLGTAADGRVLMVAYTIRRRADVETIRLISARRASRRERAAYQAQD